MQHQQGVPNLLSTRPMQVSCQWSVCPDYTLPWHTVTPSALSQQGPLGGRVGNLGAALPPYPQHPFHPLPSALDSPGSARERRVAVGQAIRVRAFPSVLAALRCLLSPSPLDLLACLPPSAAARRPSYNPHTSSSIWGLRRERLIIVPPPPTPPTRCI